MDDAVWLKGMLVETDLIPADPSITVDIDDGSEQVWGLLHSDGPLLSIIRDVDVLRIYDDELQSAMHRDIEFKYLRRRQAVVAIRHPNPTVGSTTAAYLRRSGADMARIAEAARRDSRIWAPGWDGEEIPALDPNLTMDHGELCLTWGRERSDGVVLIGDILYVPMLPETLVTALPGQPVRTLVDLPLLSGNEIIRYAAPAAGDTLRIDLEHETRPIGLLTEA